MSQMGHSRHFVLQKDGGRRQAWTTRAVGRPPRHLDASLCMRYARLMGGSARHYVPCGATMKERDLVFFIRMSSTSF